LLRKLNGLPITTSGTTKNDFPRELQFKETYDAPSSLSRTWHWNCSSVAVNKILLCTHNPISIKNIYGILRDEGFGVETAEHPALAVRMVLEQSFSAVIIDSQPFGLSVEDATKIIKTVSPETTVIMVDCNGDEPEGLGIGISTPMDLSELKNLVHNVKKVSKISNS
jgi:DNA-binding NtrC family response regulator